MFTMPPVLSQVQTLLCSFIPSGTHPSAAFDAGGQRQAQDVGAEGQAAVPMQDRLGGPAVPGV